ncbi:MAG: helix-turn-helix domain-containing protein, partial [Deltaproteobacteria bacterium]|nr:helix-turn-helix domain-containing protein [Deltaproteobacteria bacterium]
SILPKYIKESVKLPFNKVKKWQGFSLKQALKEFEMEIMQEATKKCKNQQEIAKLLGISQPTVARKLRSYKLKNFN